VGVLRQHGQHPAEHAAEHGAAPDRQANDADSYDEEYLTEFTLKVQQERTHGIITGVTG
jgi:hypothetical protein